MKIIVEYIDERTEARRTTVVNAEALDDRLIPFMVRAQGRPLKKVLFVYPEGKREEAVRWN